MPRHGGKSKNAAIPALPNLPSFTAARQISRAEPGWHLFCQSLVTVIRDDVCLSQEDCAMMRTPIELKTPWPLVNVEEDSGELVVRFHADAFLWPAVEDVGRTLISLAEEADDGELVLDLGNVEPLTGVGISKLLRL